MNKDRKKSRRKQKKKAYGAAGYSIHPREPLVLSTVDSLSVNFVLLLFQSLTCRYFDIHLFAYFLNIKTILTGATRVVRLQNHLIKSTWVFSIDFQLVFKKKKIILN